MSMNSRQGTGKEEEEASPSPNSADDPVLAMAMQHLASLQESRPATLPPSASTASFSSPPTNESSGMRQESSRFLDQVRFTSSDALDAAATGRAPLPLLTQTLSTRLKNRNYECAVCTEVVGLQDQVWSCRTCWGVFHLTCVTFWAARYDTASSTAQSPSTGPGINGLRGAPKTAPVHCPTCRALSTLLGFYLCYCGRTREPVPDAVNPPGSCGLTCERRRDDPNCLHPCPEPCHPGPCPPCPLYRNQPCYCGRHSKMVGCSSNILGFSCETVCEKELNCGKHCCTKPCHPGPCGVCEAREVVRCWCGHEESERTCSADTGYGCGKTCQRQLTCGSHFCAKRCHRGPCDQCERDVQCVKSCACGQTPLWRLTEDAKATGKAPPEARMKCLDPIPTCGNVCQKPLLCGEHNCPDKCHDSPCAPCYELVKLHCSCGASELPLRCFVRYLPQDQWTVVVNRKGFQRKEIPKEWPWHCERRCKEMKSCGRHKCENVCCGDQDHICLQVCKKKAPCGTHVCGQLCHKGPCPPCQNVSYEPLYCRCRRSVIEPPVPCGMLPPACNHPCIVPRPCGHAPNHTCHPETVECPPCIVPVEKHCGSHNTKLDWHHPCYSTPCCNKPCGKALTCCGKACVKGCHFGPCTHQCNSAFPTLGAASPSTTTPVVKGAWGKKK